MSNTNTRQKPRTGFTGRKQSIVAMAVLLGLMVLGLVGLAAATGWQETLGQISKLSLAQVLLLLGLSLVNYAIRGWRWHLFAGRLGLGTALVQNLRHFLGGFAMITTPGRVGELVRMRWIKRETGWPHEKTIPLVLMDRASDLTGMALLLGAAIILSDGGIVGAVPVAILALGLAFVATRPRLLARLAELGYRLIGRWPRLFVKIRKSARALSAFSNPLFLSTTTIVGAVGWFAEAYAFYLLLSWMGADVSLATATAIFLFAIIVGGLTGAPGGIGGADAAMLALLALEGVPFETSLAATAIIRVTTLWFGIAIGLITFPIAEKVSKRAAHALEND
ncbi:MAG: lysylphosphatidylglycerol synthase transmembrane domain-containing protein [Paracoccaceae bacterium]